MSWKNTKCIEKAVADSAYKLGDTDMAARRVLEGLGIKTKELGSYEKYRFGTAYIEECMWSRVVRYTDAILRDNSMRADLVFCTAKESALHSSNLEDEGHSLSRVDVFRDGPDCYAVAIVSEGEISSMTPPFLAVAKYKDSFIIKQKLKDFINGLNLSPKNE